MDGILIIVGLIIAVLVIAWGVNKIRHPKSKDFAQKQATLEALHATTQGAEHQVNTKVATTALDVRFGLGTSRNKILIAMIFGMFIGVLNQTLLNVALPKINEDFNIEASTGQWLMTGFMLVNGILIPISAYLFSKYTYRRLFLIAMTLFTIGSLVCGIAENFPVMMTGRVLQAIGAGVLMPLGTNVFMSLFPPEKRGSAMGLMGIAMVLAPAIGPTLSGYIVQNYHWNIMFYGMFVIGAIATILGMLWFKIYQHVENPKMDVFGVIFSTIGFGALLFGFSEAGQQGWTSTIVMSTLITGALFTLLFVIHECKMKQPMLNFEVLKYSGFTLTAMINMIVVMSLFGGMILLPIYLQTLRGFTPLDSGLLLLPGALLMGVMGPFAGKMLDKFGIKPLAIIGLIIMTYANWELTKLSDDIAYGRILWIYTVRSFGMSFIMMPIMTAGMNALPSRLVSHGNALVNTVRQLAGSIGTALLVTIMTMQTSNNVQAYQHHLNGVNSHTREQIQHAAQHLTSESELAQFIQKLASINGINTAFWFATALSVLALLMSLFLKGKSHYLSQE